MEKHEKYFVHIGLKILYYRKKQGLTQLQLAEITSFSRHHIQRIETARTTPSVSALIEIALALNISVVKLFE